MGCSGAEGAATESTDGGGVEETAQSDSGVDFGLADGASDGASDDADVVVDAVAPSPPPCTTGDRTEWAGTIPDTVIAISVCSACGESYVVAATGSATAAEVTIDNGTTTVKATVPPGWNITSSAIADKETDGTVSVCGTSNGSNGCLPMAPTNQKYCNPFRSVTKLAPERIDQGVDYAGAGPIYAIGPGIIDRYRNRNDTGWPGGTFMSYKITAGPAAGKIVYLAENIDLNPKLKSGSYVFNGTVLGTQVNASPQSETGWGVAGAGYTAEHSCYVEGCSTPLGFNFNDLLVCLKTPSGKPTSATSCCPASTASAYPASWCPLIDKWQ
jgi:hypothetical protein